PSSFTTERSWRPEGLSWLMSSKFRRKRLRSISSQAGRGGEATREGLRVCRGRISQGPATVAAPSRMMAGEVVGSLLNTFGTGIVIGSNNGNLVQVNGRHFIIDGTLDGQALPSETSRL